MEKRTPSFRASLDSRWRRTATVPGFRILGALGLLSGAAALSAAGAPTQATAPLVGNPETLLAHFERWKAGREPLDVVHLPLGWSKGRSAAFTGGSGVARIDATRGRLEIAVRDLGALDAVDAWLVPVARVSGTRGAPSAVHLAEVSLEAGAGGVRLGIDAELAALELDSIAITRSGTRPDEGGLLFGSPGLFERMLSSEQHLVTTPHSPGGLWLTPPEPGGVLQPGDHGVETLVGLGEQLFFHESFEGNGRTCGTCHPAENNFTLDADFIATLPADDPLFVAENLPELNSDLNGGLVFENPTLMREFGLIVENLDGFDDLENRFVMRGVQHMLGLGTSLFPTPGANQFTHLVGWGGDGSTGTGSLREFAIGAVRQHFPKTMGRVFGVDFRAPTEHELNALEAFLLSLGRSQDPDLTRTFLDADAELGKVKFNSVCAVCHNNAGANANFFFGSGGSQQDTGVELFTQNHPDGTGELRPIDGGFGTNPAGGHETVEANADGSFGDRSFNTQSVVEVADTLPAFHSNLTAIPDSGIANTIEGAVEFYTTDEFSQAAGGPPLDLDAEEIEQVGRFLRVLNALDNLDTIRSYAERARDALTAALPDVAGARRLARLSVEECADVVSVLSEVGLHPEAVADVQAAAALFQGATAGGLPSRLAKLEAALPLIDAAAGELVE